MTRIMYDGITPSSLPAHAEMVASYVNGKWPNYNQLAALFPNAVHVSITIDAFTDAHVIDMETGDATPDQAAVWSDRQYSAGKVPTIYCSQSRWAEQRAAIDTHGFRAPLYWIANYDFNPVMIPGAIAKQYADTAGWDASIVADYWPGVDGIGDDMTPQETQMLTDLHNWLGGGVAQGQVNEGGTIAATLSTVQGLVNKLATMDSEIRALTPATIAAEVVRELGPVPGVSADQLSAAVLKAFATALAKP